MLRYAFLGIALLWLLTVAGCGHRSSDAATPKDPEVTVSRPKVEDVTDYEDFSGRTEAVASVDLRARVSGYLISGLRNVNGDPKLEQASREGKEVKKDEVLFVIDPSIYEAEAKRADAAWQQSKARADRAKADFQRAVELKPSRSISQEEFDRARFDEAEAEAAEAAARATLKVAQQNLDWTRVLAPFTGRVSQQMIDPGNMVKADDTILTTIVAQDPMYATFDVDERTTMRVRRLIRSGQIKSADVAPMPVLLGLLDEDGFPHKGVINFHDNRVMPTTGTLRVRGRFDNPNRMLSPGQFARIRLPIGKPHSAILVAEAALGSDQGQSFVYVIDEKNEAVRRPVTLGALHGGRRVVTDGLKANERVVVKGLQQVRPETKVATKEVPMPAATPAATPPPETKTEAKPKL